jgi:hypothetical protein
MSQGRFLMDRGIFENPIWQDPISFRLFFLIVGKAVYKDGTKIGGVALNRGQWIRSYRNLQNDLEYIHNRAVIRHSLSTIKRCINDLVKADRVIVEESKLGTLFTVVNYESYQGFPEGKEHPLGTPTDTATDTPTEQLPNNCRTIRTKDLTKEELRNNSGTPDLIFSPWREYLEAHGKDASKSGGFLGLLRNTYGNPLLEEAIMDTIAADPIGAGKSPQGYLKNVLKSKAEQSKSEWGNGDPNGRGAK